MYNDLGVFQTRKKEPRPWDIRSEYIQGHIAYTFPGRGQTETKDPPLDQWIIMSVLFATL